jgi:hypothetical protein
MAADEIVVLSESGFESLSSDSFLNKCDVIHTID